MKRSIGLMLALIAPAAHAEFACSVTYASPAYLGTGGGVTVWTTPAPDCGGPLTTRVICSAGGTHFQCGKSINWGGAALLAQFDALVRATTTDQPLEFALGACASGAANNCVLGVSFGNPP